MKLTKYDKETIINGVIRDFPEINDSEAIQAALVKGMSVLCRKLYKVTPTALAKIHLRGSEVHQRAYGRDYFVGDADLATTLKPFKDKRQERKLTVDKVNQAVNACSTLAQLLERLPEFARYAPAEVVKPKNEVAVINVVADLKKQGWPVGAKK